MQDTIQKCLVNLTAFKRTENVSLKIMVQGSGRVIGNYPIKLSNFDQIVICSLLRFNVLCVYRNSINLTLNNYILIQTGKNKANNKNASFAPCNATMPFVTYRDPQDLL